MRFKFSNTKRYQKSYASKKKKGNKEKSKGTNSNDEDILDLPSD